MNNKEHEKQANELMVNAIIKALKRTNIPVIKASDDLAEILQLAGRPMLYKKKEAPETASALVEERHLTAISDADGAKILKNLQTLALEYIEKSKNNTRTFLGDLANALNIPNRGRSSRYGLYKTINNNVISIRLSNHNATVSNFDDVGETEGLSIVITGAPNKSINNNGYAHITEFYYDEQKIRKSEDKPLVDIIFSVKQALYSGEYKDTTGLAQREEVNARFLKDKTGTIYGWTSNGKIYLTKNGLNPKTMIHEYTHLWSNSMMLVNPEGWQSVKDIMRQDPLWRDVKDDTNYADIIDDEDMVVSEVLARRSEQNNSVLLERQAQKVLREDSQDMDYQANQLLFKMKEALNTFWDWVTTKLFNMKRFQSMEQVSNRVLYDLVNSTELGRITLDTDRPQYSIGNKNDSCRITDVSVIRQGSGYAVRCKIDGINQSAEKLSREDEKYYIELLKVYDKEKLNDYINRLAERYFNFQPEEKQQTRSFRR